MSLIKCPECGNSVSDKSKQCIHCGYPIQEIVESNKLYSVSIVGIIGKGWEEKGMHRRIIADILEERYQIPNQHTMFNSSLAIELEDLPKTVLNGIPKQYIDIVKQDLEATWCVVEVNEYEGEECLIDFSKAVERVNRLQSRNRCPKCSSDRITTGSRGYSLLTGFIGSNKTVNRCANCGYTWKP